MKIITLEQLIAKNDTVVERVEVSEWESSVFVRRLNGKDASEWDSIIEGRTKVMPQPDGTNKVDVNIRGLACEFVALCLCDENGEPWADTLAKRVELIKVLSSKSDLAIKRIELAATRINGMDAETREKQKSGN
jgi:hypothetical protein